MKASVLETVSLHQPNTCFSLVGAADSTTPLETFSVIADSGLEDGSQVYIRPDPYTKTSAEDHFTKAREILGFPAESTTSFAVNAGRAYSTVFAPKTPKSSKTQEKIDYSFKSFTVPADIRTFTGTQPPIVNPAVRELHLSQWNPPSPQLQLQGHLFYVVLTTMDGKQYHIVSKSNGFYVANTTDAKFDPTLRSIDGKLFYNHSLISLIQMITPQITNRIKSMTQTLAQTDPLALINPTNSFLAVPWLVDTLPPMKPDLCRTQTVFEQSRQDKDWNEDLQSTREMIVNDEEGKPIFLEKLMRERLLHKLHFDFSEAATKGALSIVKGDVASLNPNEAAAARIFLADGIFYSFGLDGMGAFAAEGGDEAARVAAGKDLLNVNIINQLDVEELHPLSTVIVDYCGRRVVCQTPVPGIFRHSSGSSDSIIVHGSVDSRNELAENENFTALFKKIAKACHLKPHAVYDNAGKKYNYDTPYETKGLIGTDGRNYILDLYRLTPPDLSFIESSLNYPHKMCFLRYELVEEWWRGKVRAALTARKVKKPENEEEEKAEREAQQKIIDQLSDEYRLNPDAHLNIESVPEEYRAELKADQDAVRQVCEFLTKVVIPNFLADILEENISTPLDSAQLTSVLHKRGINLRYLGLIDKLSAESKDSHRFVVLRRLIIIEAITRSLKHVLNRYTSQLPAETVPLVYVHFWNCLTGQDEQLHVDEMCSSFFPDVSIILTKLQQLSTSSLRQSLAEEAHIRFGLSLPSNWFEHLPLLALFRNVSLHLGLQWSSSALKKVTDLQKFEISDLLNIVPVVKSTTVRSKLASQALEQGHLSIARDEKDIGLDLINESIYFHEQVYGPVHAEVARAYSQLAATYYELNERKKACEYGLKAILISERCNGVDSAETIFFLLNQALFEHSNDNTTVSLEITKHALRLWNAISGPDHPDTLTTMNNVGTILQTNKNFKYSQEWFEAILALNAKVHGAEDVSSGSAFFHLANGQLMEKEFNKAVNSMRKALDIFTKSWGPDHETSKDCKATLEYLVKLAVGKAKDDQALSALKVRPNSTLANKVSLNSSPNVAGKPLGERSIEELLDYINGNDTKSSSKKKKNKNKK